MKQGSRVLIMMAFVTTLAMLCTAQNAGQPSTVAANTDPSSNSTTPAISPQFHTRDDRYRLQPGDTFDINFDLSPEFNQQAVAVQPDGFVTLRGVGDVKVEEQTVPQLTQTLKTAYGKILNNPIISIVLKDFQRPFFIADGQLARPGKYDLRGDTTLTEAIAMAGGFTEASKHSKVVLYRRVGDNWISAQIIDVKKMENARDLHEDPTLHPGDMVFVPKNGFSKIKAFLPNANMGAYAPIH